MSPQMLFVFRFSILWYLWVRFLFYLVCFHPLSFVKTFIDFPDAWWRAHIYKYYVCNYIHVKESLSRNQILYNRFSYCQKTIKFFNFFPHLNLQINYFLFVLIMEAYITVFCVNKLITFSMHSNTSVFKRRFQAFLFDSKVFCKIIFSNFLLLSPLAIVILQHFSLA